MSNPVPLTTEISSICFNVAKKRRVATQVAEEVDDLKKQLKPFEKKYSEDMVEILKKEVELLKIKEKESIALADAARERAEDATTMLYLHQLKLCYWKKSIDLSDNNSKCCDCQCSRTAHHNAAVALEEKYPSLDYLANTWPLPPLELDDGDDAK